MDEFATYFREAKEAGLGITLHIAEVYSPPYLHDKSLCLSLDFRHLEIHQRRRFAFYPSVLTGLDTLPSSMKKQRLLYQRGKSALKSA